MALSPAAKAKEMLPACPVPKAPLASQTIARAGVPGLEEAAAPVRSMLSPATAINPSEPLRKLIVIGFMGGNVRANDFVHREASMARDLEQRYPLRLHAAVFANSHGHAALQTVLQLLDKDKNGCLSATEKSAARIVIYGHSWGASQTVALAQRLNELDIPVLLTIQVDSVQKLNEHDGRIPPNVRQAINFYQSDGLLHGRPLIQAMDPKQTTILGNFESAYKENPISCAGYPWYARAFMKPHIEIENDPRVWNRIEALIQTELL
jgi:pimeloyl-ACP methyl ester carboxylesterase